MSPMLKVAALYTDTATARRKFTAAQLNKRVLIWLLSNSKRTDCPQLACRVVNTYCGGIVSRVPKSYIVLAAETTNSEIEDIASYQFIGCLCVAVS